MMMRNKREKMFLRKRENEVEREAYPALGGKVRG